MLQLNGTVLLRHAGTPSIRPLQFLVEQEPKATGTAVTVTNGSRFDA